MKRKILRFFLFPTGEIVEKMLGRKFEENFPKEACQIGEVLFQTEHLSGAGGKVKDVSIQVKKGEVVGIAGLVGAGKSELCKTIFGAYKKTGGKVMLKNRELKIANPSGAVKNRMALVLHRTLYPQEESGRQCQAVCKGPWDFHTKCKAAGQKSFRRQPAKGSGGKMACGGLRCIHI